MKPVLKYDYERDSCKNNCLTCPFASAAMKIFGSLFEYCGAGGLDDEEDFNSFIKSNTGVGIDKISEGTFLWLKGGAQRAFLSTVANGQKFIGASNPIIQEEFEV